MGRGSSKAGGGGGNVATTKPTQNQSVLNTITCNDQAKAISTLDGMEKGTQITQQTGDGSVVKFDKIGNKQWARTRIQGNQVVSSSVTYAKGVAGWLNGIPTDSLTISKTRVSSSFRGPSR